MTTPRQRNRLPADAPWAADNGKFGQGWPGPEAWFLWLQREVRRYGAEQCQFAVAPDVPFDATGTYHESRPWLPWIRDLGIPAAYAAQNGAEHDLLPWGEFDVLFLAGDTEWKTGPIAQQLTREATARGIATHMGRVNSLKRLRIAEWFGCASADGTYIARAPRINLRRCLDWLATLERIPSLAAELAPDGGT